jgi:hypothetical protein
MISGSYRPAPAVLGDLVRDLGFIEEFAASLGLQSTFLATATSLVEQTIELGFGDGDPAAVLEAVRARMDASTTANAAGRAGAPRPVLGKPGSRPRAKQPVKRRSSSAPKRKRKRGKP